jgi:hypothetical protein
MDDENQPTLEDWKAEAEKWNRAAKLERDRKDAWREAVRALSAAMDLDEQK